MSYRDLANAHPEKLMLVTHSEKEAEEPEQQVEANHRTCTQNVRRRA